MTVVLYLLSGPNLDSSLTMLIQALSDDYQFGPYSIDCPFRI